MDPEKEATTAINAIAAAERMIPIIPVKQVKSLSEGGKQCLVTKKRNEITIELSVKIVNVRSDGAWLTALVRRASSGKRSEPGSCFSPFTGNLEQSIRPPKVIQAYSVPIENVFGSLPETMLWTAEAALLTTSGISLAASDAFAPTLLIGSTTFVASAGMLGTESGKPRGPSFGNGTRLARSSYSL